MTGCTPSYSEYYQVHHHHFLPAWQGEEAEGGQDVQPSQEHHAVRHQGDQEIRGCDISQLIVIVLKLGTIETCVFKNDIYSEFIQL